jgi:hypothetical protein
MTRTETVTASASRRNLVKSHDWMREHDADKASETELFRTMLAEFKANNIIEDGKWESISEDIFRHWFASAFTIRLRRIETKRSRAERS